MCQIVRASEDNVLSEQARTTATKKSGVAAALRLCQAKTKLKYKAVLQIQTRCKMLQCKITTSYNQGRLGLFPDC
jgi:hypothetical protein